MEVKRERLLITVKTYPVLSKRYVELVCTAGLRTEGSWVRIYPIPFRTLRHPERYKKFDWVECELYKNERDKRPESFSPLDFHNIVQMGHVGTNHEWRERREMILNNTRVFSDLKVLIQEAKSNKTSLAVFKPTKLVNFEYEETEEDWDPLRARAAKSALIVNDLFDDNSWRKNHELPEKIPYDFYYRFEDENSTESRLKILDWEIGMLYLNCLERARGDRTVALQKVREKYWTSFKTTDLHFFLGTTLEFHDIAPNPFTIVGVFPIPRLPSDLFS